MTSFEDAREALRRTIRAVYPAAKPIEGWAGVETWGVPRPKHAVEKVTSGTYDPTRITIGIADRKSGPVVYFLDPGDYHALETHRALLTGAGFKLGRGCIMHTRKGPLPVDALETLFRRTKARDAAARPRAAKASGARISAAPSVDAYLAALPADQRAALERLRKQIRVAAPRAEESISYGMPAWRHEGPLVYIAAFRDHLSFFPGGTSALQTLKDEVKEFQTSKGTLRFTPARPLPAALVRRIVEMRVAENEARAARRKARTKKAVKKPARAPRKKPAKTAPRKAARRRS
jgi:uncharacterized protein YdhG (YjbR/CyaY superfamily)